MSTITLTFTNCSTSDGSCTFNDGSNNIFTLTEISIPPYSTYIVGETVSWSCYNNVVDASGTTLINNEYCYVYYNKDDSANKYQAGYYDNYVTLNQPTIFNPNYNIYSIDASSGETYNNLQYTLSGIPVSSVNFNNNSITPNSTTSPSSWTFSGGGESTNDYVNNSNEVMTFYSDVNSTENVQNVAIAGTICGVHELIQGTSSTQTLTNGYIASLALLLYARYGIYGV